MALFPIISLAFLAAVESLLAAGAGEEGDVGDTAVGAARGHGGHAGEFMKNLGQWKPHSTIASSLLFRYRKQFY